MCDTFVTLAPATLNGSVLLAKNSDREPDEAQALTAYPRTHHTETEVKVTYRRIPQVKETYSCVLSRPFQMWGAEMGVNEWGVAIGNEAVFTKVPFVKDNSGLTGMDLLRLALERSRTAAEAVDAVTSLLEQFGQDACGGYRNKKFFYHNSFLIADPSGAWVLETAGREWVTEKVKDIRSISNRLSIGVGDQLSSNAISGAVKMGWHKEGKPFSFAASYSDWLYTTMGRARQRQQTTELSCRRMTGRMNVMEAMQTLSQHNKPHPGFRPSRANTGSVCMHATGLLNPSQTTGSMVAQLRKGGPHTVWLTGTSSPCLSLYIPFFPGTSTLLDVVQPSEGPDESLWWQAEKLHRWISRDYQERRMVFEVQRTALQQELLEGEQRLIASGAGLPALEQFSNESLRKVLETIRRWSSMVRAQD